jgi:hypothetical protein
MTERGMLPLPRLGARRMGILDTIKSWLTGGARRVAEDEGPAFDPESFVYLKIPGDIQPIDRGEWFEDRIEPALAEAGLGTVSGGGSSLSEPRADGSRVIEYCGVDIDVTELEPALVLLRALLPQLPITPGTELQYTRGGVMFRDLYRDGEWVLAQPRQDRHPGFGV